MVFVSFSLSPSYPHLLNKDGLAWRLDPVSASLEGPTLAVCLLEGFLSARLSHKLDLFAESDSSQGRVIEEAYLSSS